MRGSILVIFLLFCGQDIVRCIHIQELRVPAHVAAGGEALLGCQYHLEGDDLYSVKWYKDDVEIYRYTPHNIPNQMRFIEKGVTVDLSRSSSRLVTLTNIEPQSAGMYRCEVTGEAPSFAYDIAEKYVTVHVLPKDGPRTTGFRKKYNYGEYVIANCTSAGSSPEAFVKWLLNNRPVYKDYVRGPWRTAGNDPPNTVEVTLGLRLMVMPRYFRNGKMEIKCQATIAPMYHKEVPILLNAPILDYDAESESTEDDTARPSTEGVWVESLTPLRTKPSVLDLNNNDPISKEYGDIREQAIDDFLENLESAGINVPPVASETPNSLKDNATLLERSLGAIIVALLLQVILLL